MPRGSPTGDTRRARRRLVLNGLMSRAPRTGLAVVAAWASAALAVAAPGARAEAELVDLATSDAAGSAGPEETVLDARCPVVEQPMVLAFGSSTLASLLGPILRTELERDGLRSHFFGVASSGLARPDYYDWFAKGAKLVDQHAPDVVVIELGTNDYQPLWEDDHWVKRSDPRWEVLYASRVDALLELVGGPAKQRLVIWVGPYSFWADNALEQGPVVDRVLRDRLSTWVARGGRAIYVDAWAATTDAKGRPIMKRPIPGLRGLQEIRTPDGVHLKGWVVRDLFAEPVISAVRGCVAARTGRERERGPVSDRGASPSVHGAASRGLVRAPIAVAE